MRRVLFGFLLFGALSCSRQDDDLVLAAQPATGVGVNGAVLHASFGGGDPDGFSSVGFLWGMDGNLQERGRRTDIFVYDREGFSHTLTSLWANATYYYAAVADYRGTPQVSAKQKFTTERTGARVRGVSLNGGRLEYEYMLPAWTDASYKGRVLKFYFLRASDYERTWEAHPVDYIAGIEKADMKVARYSMAGDGRWEVVRYVDEDSLLNSGVLVADGQRRADTVEFPDTDALRGLDYVIVAFYETREASPLQYEWRSAEVVFTGKLENNR